MDTWLQTGSHCYVSNTQIAESSWTSANHDVVCDSDGILLF